MMYLILSSIKLRSISGIAVELMPPDLEVVGSNIAGCWAVFFLLPSSVLSRVSLKEAHLSLSVTGKINS